MDMTDLGDFAPGLAPVRFRLGQIVAVLIPDGSVVSRAAVCDLRFGLDEPGPIYGVLWRNAGGDFQRVSVSDRSLLDAGDPELDDKLDAWRDHKAV